MKTDFLIVGAGFAGSTVAERVAVKLKKKVLIVEKRNHIGGNAFDYYNEDGILMQKYGPHIFHTNSKRVWDYLSRFTEWNNYVHRVLASINGKEVYLPINLDTMERLYDRKFTEKGLREYFDQKRVRLAEISNSRDVIVSQIGEELYDMFFKNYTKKQWGVYPDKLDPQVAGRLPVRFNRDTRYFADVYQGIPKNGFTRMFEKMLDNKDIHVLLNTDYRDIVGQVEFDRLVFTGPIDSYFEHKFGQLPYRSLDFGFKTLDTKKYQKAAVVNYPNEHKYTRVTEFKQFYMQKHDRTTICFEYPKAKGDPYYPIPNPAYRAIYERYKKEADNLRHVYFLGRLAEYRYLNMDQVVEGALTLYDNLTKK